MSHMDPVSGTDIDLFIEGIIPCSLHLEHRMKPERDIYNPYKISLMQNDSN